MYFHKGDKVRVVNNYSYGNRLNNAIGTIVNVCNTGVAGIDDGNPGKIKYGVNLDGFRNPNSNNGIYWFYPRELKIYTDYAHLSGLYDTPSRHILLPPIKQVIFNAPKTIVLFEDGSKTIVNCGDGDNFDEYAGLCAALAKRAFGSTNAINTLLKGDKIKRMVLERGDKND